jgi:hypothetical protein
MAHPYHPSVIHRCNPGQPVKAVSPRCIPTAQLWINLWKLWIAIGNCWCCRDRFRGPHRRRAVLDCPALPRKREVPPQRPLPRPASSPELGWSGDPGVLPVRHAVERARPETRVVPPLPRGADGTPAGHAGGRPTMECVGRPTAGQTARGPSVAAHPAAAAARIPVDRGASWRRAASATGPSTPGTHTALRRDTALGLGGPRRPGACGS